MRARPWLRRDTDIARIMRMLVRERDEHDRLPCIERLMLYDAKRLLGIRLRPVGDGLEQWELPADWADRLRRAGIDPATLELVDLEAWQRTMKALEQAKANKQREWTRVQTQQSIKKAVQKYMPPPAPNPTQVIANHVMTGRIARELQREK